MQAAIDAATAGDTIYLEGSAFDYDADNGVFIVAKKLYLFGPGYFLADNDSTLFQKSPATTGASAVGLEFTAGSEGSIIAGITVGYLFVGASNITIKRNHILIDVSLGSTFNNWVSISYPVVSQNIIRRNIYCNNNLSSVSYGLIVNNIIEGIIYLQYGGNNEIINNTISGSSEYSHPYTGTFYSIHTTNSIIKNNISLSAISSGIEGSINNTITSNIANQGADFSNHFIGGEVPDKKYILKTTSSAIGAGVDGEDCGAFGGTNPYVLSGLPPIPRIWDISVPVSGSANSGLPVLIKVKTQN